MTKATMLLSAISAPGVHEQGRRLAKSTNAIEVSKNHAWREELSSMRLERIRTSRDEILKWPAVPAICTKPNDAGFQSAFVDVLPEPWIAVSLSLSESHDELYISKHQAKQSPFTLRLPLTRHSSRDADEAAFSFAQGKHELLEIIELSNFSTQGPKDPQKKGAKTEWWSAREALDSRLKDLLINIETVWLGGFRGIFSQEPRNVDLLARFQASMQDVFDKNLPSRRHRTKRSKAPTVELHHHVLELFVNLGNQSSEDSDLDESLTDLLYFVIDIMQSNGERNAYDEIDFDSLIVDTLEALRCYHAAAATTSEPVGNRHTILVLDRHLHSIPWESLPVLQGLSVSRVSSLAQLRELVVNMPLTSYANEHGLFISPSSGSYILNPSGDLKHTESVFSPPLSKITSTSIFSWSSVTGRPPSETEFSSLLSRPSSDSFLYFGHGSGAQYIQSRTIRKLPRLPSAVVLMGCSSAFVHEEGSSKAGVLVSIT